MVNTIISANSNDVIIENLIENWRASMLGQTPKEKWEVPEYSKKQINNAGKIITSSASTQEERNQALAVLNNWRASHAYPLQVICSNLRFKIPDAIVVQRLKRLESITGKIKRFPDMNLYRIQDLGGCRVIIDSIDQVYDAIDKYKHSRIRHILKREDDYIQTPKTSGYRSYHMVYQFQSAKKETYNKNMLIEIQFRTKLQHTWATAVEMMGIYTKSNLKSSQGDEDILRFFILVSSLFAMKENTPICPNTSDKIENLLKEIIEIDNRNNILSKLIALSDALHVTDTSSEFNYKNGYYLLTLNYIDNFLSIKAFKPSEIEIATKAYNTLEQERDPLKDIVLVSASSFNSLKVAYPNYFVDISKFISTLNGSLSQYRNLIK